MVPTLDPRITLEALYSAILFTLVRLQLDPRLQPFAAPFELALAEWWDILKKERALLDNRVTARANVVYADTDLDGTSDGVAGIILIEVKNNRRAPLFMRYFGTQQPRRFRRSVLGPQLAQMRTWPPSLKESTNPALNAYGELLTKQIAAADSAIELLSAADQQITDFRRLGERKQLFDKVNGLRKKLYGDVAKMVHDHPEWNLTRDFINALFEHASPPDLTAAELDQKIEAAGAEVTRLKALREQRIKDEKAEEIERAAAEKKLKLAALGAAEKAAAAANAKVTALKAEIEPTPA